MGRLAAVAGLIKSFILIITLPDLFAVGLVAFVATPDLLAEIPPQSAQTSLDANMLVVLMERPRLFRRPISS